uniref:Uncharacterized protein n=1 Tax=Trichogramma kaykai TaxID=54128 RepID=A0ABD2WMH9_9HYME
MTTELEGVFGDVATASALRHTTSIEVRDLDESTTAEEVRRALGTQLSSPGLEPGVVQSLRSLCRRAIGPKTAKVDRHASSAEAMTQINKRPPAGAAHEPERPSGPPTMSFLQLNLNHCETAQDLLRQTVCKRRIDVAIVCDQFRNLDPPYTRREQGNTTPGPA